MSGCWRGLDKAVDRLFAKIFGDLGQLVRPNPFGDVLLENVARTSVDIVVALAGMSFRFTSTAESLKLVERFI